MGNNNYFIKMDFLESESEIKAFFQRDFPNITSIEDEVYILAGEKDIEPQDILLNIYNNPVKLKNKPVTIAGSVKLNVKWFHNLHEGEYSPEFFDILFYWGFAVLHWLENQVDPNILSAIISCGYRREPKLYFVFKPEFMHDINISLSESRQRLILAELEDKFVEYLLSLGLGATTNMQDFEYASLKEFNTFGKLFQAGKICEMPEIDFERVVTQKDYYLYLRGGEPLRKRLTELAGMAFQEFGSKFHKTFTAGTEELIRESRHNATRQAKLNFLARKAERYAERSESVKGPNLRLVLTRLYGADQSENKLDQASEYEFLLPNGRRIAVHKEKWSEFGTEDSGNGAISLINQLSGYPRSDYSSAFRELCSVFSKDSAQKALLYYLTQDTKESVELLLKTTFKMPETSEDYWEKLKVNLPHYEKISPWFLDFFHRKGFISADIRGSLLFVCDQSSGVFRMRFKNTNEFATLESPRRDSLPFFLPGNRRKLIIAENPLLALKLKEREFDAEVLAYGEFTPLTRLLPYLQGRNIVIHHAAKGPHPTTLKEFLLNMDFHFFLEYGYVLNS
ncbi:MAG: hypothetical protein LBR53_02185 [Deltaproteobacteria bacterium]|jgi:hypothetical protein|nr:hypothetical protein [Deltaproteobacteria bacterium]